MPVFYRVSVLCDRLSLVYLLLDSWGLPAYTEGTLIALIIYSHGSVLCGAGEALDAHVTRLKLAFDWVNIGYLNYSEPRFAETAEAAIAAGATTIIVVPYLLISGYFVQKALPEILNPIKEAHPNIEFIVAEALNVDTLLADAVIEAAKTGVGTTHWDDRLLHVQQSCRPHVDCPFYGTHQCPLVPGYGEPLPLTSLTQAKPATPAPLPLTSETHLLVMVHGTPRPVANNDMFTVIEQVKERGIFAHVEIGFMECNEPTIPEAIDNCVATGATQIVAVPYFVHAGTHVCQDLPELLREGQERYPSVSFALGNYIGLSENLTQLLIKRAKA
jgi:sirohydrochlorin ferrochelatase